MRRGEDSGRDNNGDNSGAYCSSVEDCPVDGVTYFCIGNECVPQDSSDSDGDASVEDGDSSFEEKPDEDEAIQQDGDYEGGSYGDDDSGQSGDEDETADGVILRRPMAIQFWKLARIPSVAVMRIAPKDTPA